MGNDAIANNDDDRIGKLDCDGDIRKTGQEMDLIRQRTIAYEYLCRLEEAKNYTTIILDIGTIFKFPATDYTKCGQALKLYNKLPLEIRKLTDKEFESTVKSMLIEKSYYSLIDVFSDKFL